MPYCLDTDIFIEAFKGYYAFDIVPGFWDSLITLGEQGLLFSVRSVYDEIIGHGDELSTWVRNLDGNFFMEPSPEVTAAYTRIADHVLQNYEPHHVETFLSGADPWVIASAIADGSSVVVTDERIITESRNPQGIITARIKIPNICRVFNLNCIGTYTLLRTFGCAYR